MARMRIGDMLIAVGLIDEEQLKSALAHQRQWGGRLGDALIDKGFLDEMMLYMGLAKQMNVQLVSIAQMEPPRDVIGTVAPDICKRHDLMPVALADRELTVAMADPSNVAAIDEVGFSTGFRVRTVIAPAREIEWAHRRYFHGEVAPCPPPRVRGKRIPTGEIEIVRPGAGGTTTVASTTEGEALPPDPTLHLGEPVLPAPADPLLALDDGLRETTHLLRLLVDTCVARGLFSREEYLERVKKVR